MITLSQVHISRVLRLTTSKTPLLEQLPTRESINPSWRNPRLNPRLSRARRPIMASNDQQQPATPGPLAQVKALTFDVFGTVVDWRTSVVRELIQAAHDPCLAESSRPRLSSITEADWATFAQQWRDTYGVFTSYFKPGVTPWKDIDAHHYDSLVELLAKWNLEGVFPEKELRRLSLVWHRLGPWDESSAGIKALNQKYVTSTLSNGTPALLEDLNKLGDLSFQVITSTAEFGAYKPHPCTYLGVVKKLGLETDQVAMVAAHLNDLEAARKHGLKTIYVERAMEEAWADAPEKIEQARSWVDLWVNIEGDGFLEVARRLGIPPVH